jgi:hypothetical protein
VARQHELVDGPELEDDAAKNNVFHSEAPGVYKCAHPEVKIEVPLIKIRNR